VDNRGFPASIRLHRINGNSLTGSPRQREARGQKGKRCESVAGPPLYPARPPNSPEPLSLQLIEPRWEGCSGPLRAVSQKTCLSRKHCDASAASIQAGMVSVRSRGRLPG
jgi:hypothetical protein